MFVQIKNGTHINPILKKPTNKLKKVGHSIPRNHTRLSVFGGLTKLQYSVDLHNKRNEKKVIARSITDIKQQIHKLRTQSIQLSLSPLTTERTTSCVLQNNQTTQLSKGNDILDIIKAQSQIKLHKAKDLLPKITINNNHQQHQIFRQLQDTQIVPNTKQPYLRSSVVRVPRIVRHRLDKLAHSDQSNQNRARINHSISRWQSSQIQEPFLREMSNMR